ncbi:hypothetical protein U9M48_037241 [Paspalum notatum var. saurae]|uniref:Uncharacterized protein n=1 Tax=Paspalum notatum var. saurae TaxID=547442 RepID=A0AAQ3UJ94_PASNO
MSATPFRTKDPRVVLFFTASTRSGIEPRPSSGPRTHIGGCEIMKTRETTLKPERDQLYSRFWKTRRMTTTPTTDKDELNDDHSYDGWR